MVRAAPDLAAVGVAATGLAATGAAGVAVAAGVPEVAAVELADISLLPQPAASNAAKRVPGRSRIFMALTTLGAWRRHANPFCFSHGSQEPRRVSAAILDDRSP